MNKTMEIVYDKYLDFDRLMTLERCLVRRTLIMRQRRLRNGILVNYTFEHKFGCPHFEFFSYDLSDTGYRSDFLEYGLTLTEERVLEAFDIRASMHYENHLKWTKKREAEAIREQRSKAKQEREQRASQIVQLTLGF